MSESTSAGRIAALIGLGGAIVVVLGLLVGGSDDYEVTASFENASQLVGGEEVVVGGVGVGTVEEIELGDEGEALVSFSVSEPGYAPLPRGTTATVRSFSLSGIANRQIQLALPSEGEADRGEIPDGGRMSQAETVSEVDLDQIFNALDDETVADLKRVIRGFEVSSEGVGPEANRGFRYLNPFLSSSRRLFEELTLDERALEQLIVDGSQLSGAVAGRRRDLSALVANLERTMAALASQKTALAESIRELPAFMRSFNTTAVNLRATLDDLDPLVDASKPVAKRLGPFFGEFRAAAANLVPTVRDLDAVIERPGTANDLVDLNRSQPALTTVAVGPVSRNGASRRGAFPESVTALGDSLPQLAFFRAYSPELTGWFDDFGHSGIVDASGGIGRIGTTFNAFSLSPNGLPDALGTPLTPTELEAALNTGNLERCPGSNERPAADDSNPYTEAGALDCDPSQVPPGG